MAAHRIKSMSGARIVCGCGWDAWAETLVKGTDKRKRDDAMLDAHAAHAAGLAQQGR